MVLNGVHADGVRVGPGRVQRSWLHRLTATPMRTTSGQNWLQVMREKAAQPGQNGVGLQGAAPVPQIRAVGMSGQNMVSLCNTFPVQFECVQYRRPFLRV